MILRRLPDSRFSEVVPEWRGATVVLLGAGPSLTLEHLKLIRAAREADRIRVIAINDLYLLAPWSDVHYAADSHWHAWHGVGISKPTLGLPAEMVRQRWASFVGQKCSIEQSGSNIRDEAVHILRNVAHPKGDAGLSRDPRALVTGFHSGFQALNLAVLAGADTVILCGFDAREPTNEIAAHGLTGDHPRPTPLEVYAQYRRAFSVAAPLIRQAGVSVFNASPLSAMESFPFVELAAVLREPVPA